MAGGQYITVKLRFSRNIFLQDVAELTRENILNIDFIVNRQRLKFEHL